MSEFKVDEEESQKKPEEYRYLKVLIWGRHPIRKFYLNLGDLESEGTDLSKELETLDHEENHISPNCEVKNQ